MVHYINQQIRAGVRRHRRGGGQGEKHRKKYFGGIETPRYFYSLPS